MIDGVTVTVPAFVPLPGDTLSQLTPSDAVQSIDPPPVFETANVLAAGDAPPAVPLNDSVAGVTDSAGGVGGSTVNVTATVFGEPVAPADATVMSVVYVPAPSPVIVGVTVTVPPFVPLAGDTLSQLALSDAVQSIDPPPVFETANVLAAGDDPPAVPENASVAGVTDSTGGAGGSTVKSPGSSSASRPPPRRSPSRPSCRCRRRAR